MIAQAIFGTVGVFVGMLVVYKTGAIRVTPKFTRIMVAAMFGVVAIALLNFVLAMFGVGGGEGSVFVAVAHWRTSSRSSASVWRHSCFLIDFDQADQLIRAGAPAKAAWGIALGLTVTLVWLYLEILWLLCYFNSD